MDSSEYEEIGGYRFSLPRSGKERSISQSRWPSIVISLLIIAGLLAISKWIVWEIERGNWERVRWAPMILFGLIYVSPLAVLIVMVRKRKRQAPARITPPGGIPATAVNVRAIVISGGQRVAASNGWLWAEEDFLTFRGEMYQFQLRPRDFREPDDLPKLASGKPMGLLTPKGIPSRTVKVVGVDDPGGTTMTVGRTNSEIKSVLDQWRRAAITNRPSLFPPLRRAEAQVNIGKLLVGTLGVGVGLGLVLWICALLFREYVAQNNPLALFGAGLALPLMLMLVVWMERIEVRSHNRKIETLKALGKVELV
jgi:hypothetical protein